MRRNEETSLGLASKHSALQHQRLMQQRLMQQRLMQQRLMQHGFSGLGFGWSDAAEAAGAKMNKDKNVVATKIASTATTDPAFGSPGWKVVRNNWYDAIHMAGTADDEAKMQISTVNDITDRVSSDLANPIATRWDDTALGNWFAKTVTKARTKSGWQPYAADPDNTKFGNRLAIWVYKTLKPDIWPTIANYLSNGPVFTFKEYLDVFGLSNPAVKTADFYAKNPNYDPRVERKLAEGYNAPQVQPEQQQQAQPYPQAEKQQVIPLDSPATYQAQPNTDLISQDQLPDSQIKYDAGDLAPATSKSNGKTVMLVSLGVAAVLGTVAVVLWRKSKHEA